MTHPILRKMIAVSFFAGLVNISMAQDPGIKSNVTVKTESKPFRILTNGQRITIQSTQDIQRIMAWTTSGHRIVEQTSFASQSYSFVVPNNEKFLFVMVQLKNGKHYTEKIGI